MQATVPNLIDEVAERLPDAPALLLPPASRGRQPGAMTYGELAHQSRVVAASLERLGMTRGDALAIWLPNDPEWLVLALAAMRLGGFVAPINTRFRHADAAYVLRATEARFVAIRHEFLEVDFAAQLATAVADGSHELDATIVVPEPATEASLPSDFQGSGRVMSYGDLLDGDGLALGDVRAEPDTMAHLYVSSGTTGSPKLAIHDHRSIVSRFTAAGRHFGLQAGSVMLGALPFAGAWGYGAAFTSLSQGAALVPIRVFDPATIVDAVEACGVTHIHGSDDMLRAIMRDPTFSRERCQTWQFTHYGNFTGLAGVDIIHEGAEVGVNFSAAYGASEFHAFLAAWHGHEDPELRSRAGGWVINEDVDVRCVDMETGEVLPHETPGEIQVRGTSVMSGYLANQDLTASVLTDDGWYASGDLGESLDGRGVIFHSRAKDTLRLRGYLVDPREIEQELMAHDAVDLAQVVGLQTEDRGQVAIAFVRLTSTVQTSPQELQEFCRARVASYKVPTRVHLVDEFPVVESPNGVKIQKSRLREMAEEMWP